MSDENLFDEVEPTVEVEEEDEFLTSLTQEFGEFLNIDPAQIVTLRSSAGQSWPVPVEQPTAVKDLVRQANLTLGTEVVVWVDGATVSMDQVVPGGAIVTLVGNVKGGIG